MVCRNPITYVIRQGDTLFKIARDHHTTVPQIYALNPGIDAYNLQIGSALTLCPGVNSAAPPAETEPRIFPIPPIGTIRPPVTPVPPIGTIPPIVTPVPPIGTIPPITPVPPIGILPPVMPVPPIGTLPPCPGADLCCLMRLLWAQHVYWTRMLIISICERLRDQNDVARRLLKNPGDIAAVFAKYYPQSVAQNISDLLTEHLQIGANLITALRDQKTKEADGLNREWHANADKMADYFASINSKYDCEELRKMLYEHLALTAREVNMRLKQDYPADIEAFNQVEREAMKMADYFTAGLS